MEPNVAAAVEYAYSRLQNELSDDFRYHNISHTFEDVLPNAMRMADAMGICGEDRLLLETAAAYHDIGYPRQPDNHEAIGEQIAGEVLPQFGYSQTQIGRIQALIRATRLPQNPQSLLAEILCDADLDLLGRPDFAHRNHDLRDEMAARGKPSTLLNWYQGQQRFLTSHRYHTKIARETRLAGKDKNLAMLSSRLLTLRLSAFMPRDLRKGYQTAQATDPDAAYKSTKRNGTALFADIAGFTKLTEQLIEQYGMERGAEAILQAINPLYDAIIPVLYQFDASVVRMQGNAINSVIGFAGDSITCWLDGDTSSERAVACAFTMQTAIENQLVQLADGKQQKMQLKIGIASGDVRRMQVGNPDLGLYDVLAGQTVANMAIAADMADSAEIIVCPKTACNLGQNITAEPLSNGYLRALSYDGTITPHPYQEPDFITDPAIARQWVLAPIADRLASGGFLAELRPAAALFMRFHGLDFDSDNQSKRKLDQLIRWVQTILQQTSGYLIQLSVGDKGSYLYAAFGAPLAFAGNARRAATAALTLRNAPQQFPFISSVEIGISQGRMWTGAYGSQTRSTYGVISRATNLAARLMESAESNQILVHSSVHRELIDFQLQQLSDRKIKGFDDTHQIWSLIGIEQVLSSFPRFDRPLIGRDNLLSHLLINWQRVKTGQGRAIALIGEAGIGKSHLAATLVFDIESFGGSVHWSRADQTRRNLFYDVWRQLFISLFALTPSLLNLPPDELLDHLANTIGEGFFADDERLPLLGDLLGVPLPDNQTTAAFEPAVRRESLFALLLALLELYSEKPLCLIIDDAHLLDDASEPFLMRVLQSMQHWQLYLVLIRRPPEDEASSWQEMTEQTLLQIAKVDALKFNVLSILIENQLGAPPTDLLARLVERQTHGNPFYLESLVETLREDNKVQLIEGEDLPNWDISDELLERLQAASCVQLIGDQWELDPSADLAAIRLGLPDSVHRSVLTRIDRLKETTKLVLKIASVIGQQFELDLLTASHPQTAQNTDLKPQLEKLVKGNLIRKLSADTYQFQHHSTQEVTYNTLLFAQRQDLHRQVMLALLRMTPDADVAIAQHSFEAEEWAIALPHLQHLGQRAQQLYANHQSVASYERVLTCLKNLDRAEDGEQIRSVHLALGESLLNLGRYSEALSHLSETRGLAETAHDSRILAKACRLTARVHELQGDYREAIDWLEQGLAADQNESRESAELYLIAGLIESHRGNYDASQNLCNNAIAMAQHFDAPEILGRAYNLAGILALYQGQNEEAIKQFEQALITYRGCSNRRGEALALNQLANANFDRGNWQAANKAYMASRAIFIETGDVYNRLLVDNNIGGIARNQRRLFTALAYYEDALQSLEQIGGSAYAKGALYMNRANTQASLGDLVAAQADLVESRQLLESAEVRVLMPELTRSEALLASLQNDQTSAAAKADLSIQLARELKMKSEEGHGLRVRGLIAINDCDLQLAEKYLDESLSIMQENAELFGTAQTLEQLAELYAKQAKFEQHREAASAAQAIYAQLGVENTISKS